MIRYVLGFAFNEDYSKVALIEKTKPDWQKGLLNGIGGKIEDDESPHDAMVREFREETGVNNDNFSWFNVTVMKGEDWEVQVFTSNTIDIESIKTTTEETVGIYDVNDVITRKVQTISNLPWLITSIIDEDYLRGRLSIPEVRYF